jgi:hypothetical protein
MDLLTLFNNLTKVSEECMYYVPSNYFSLVLKEVSEPGNPVNSFVMFSGCLNPFLHWHLVLSMAGNGMWTFFLWI